MPGEIEKPIDDALVFFEEDGQAPILSEGTWKVLIVDDEQVVHSVTKWVLKDFVYHQKKVEFLSAYSAVEAMDLLVRHQDLAVILLDVVMEEQDSGLKLVQYIREELENKNIRIILRTGQAGLAPENKVILDYDINDYKEKDRAYRPETDLCSGGGFADILRHRNHRSQPPGGWSR